MRVYCAGPMRHWKDFNYPAFDAARDLLKRRGHEPVSPADLDRAATHAAAPPNPLPAGYLESAFKRDFAALATCDAIYLLKGWAISEGAKVEYQMAKLMGLTIMFERQGVPKT